MSGIMNRIKQFATSPQGRRLVDEAKRTAKDPRKREQAKQALSRLRGKR